MIASPTIIALLPILHNSVNLTKFSACEPGSDFIDSFTTFFAIQPYPATIPVIIIASVSVFTSLLSVILIASTQWFSIHWSDRKGSSLWLLWPTLKIPFCWLRLWLQLLSSDKRHHLFPFSDTAHPVRELYLRLRVSEQARMTRMWV